jgi:ERCC4-type nuclease
MQQKPPEQINPQPNRYKFVDDREPEDMRNRLLELGWEQKRLFSSDYTFLSGNFKRVGITRKTVRDLSGSLGDIFTKQLEEMLDYFEHNIILIEGSWKEVYDDKATSFTGIPIPLRKMILNYLHRWMQKGFIVELTSNSENTVTRLNELYALYQKEYSLSGRSKEFEDDRVMAFPSGCRGKTALKVLDSIGSIREVALANIDALMGIEGIGEKKATSIWNHLNRR